MRLASGDKAMMRLGSWPVLFFCLLTLVQLPACDCTTAQKTAFHASIRSTSTLKEIRRRVPAARQESRESPGWAPSSDSSAPGSSDWSPTVQKTQAPQGSPQGPPSAPHIVVIMVDDLGWSDASFNSKYDHSIPTPNLEKLASSGIVLKQHITYPICTPSRAAFLTGRSPSEFGLNYLLRPWDNAGIPSDVETLPEFLKNSSSHYSTHLVGKWHLGFSKNEFLPTRQGFDTFFGYLTGTQDYYSHISGGLRFMGTHHGQLEFEGPTPEELGITDDDQWRTWKGLDFWRNEKISWEFAQGDRLRYSTHLYAQEAENIIDNHAAQHCSSESGRECAEPMFLMVTLQAPHTPIEVPSHYSNLAKKQIPTVPSDIKSNGDASRWYRYAGMIMCADEAIGNITDALGRNGMLEDSMVVFLGDNGAAAGDDHVSRLSNYPFRGGKATLFEGGIRTPALVSGGKWVSDMLKKSLQPETDSATLPPSESSLSSSEFQSSSRLIHITDWYHTITEIVRKCSSSELSETDPAEKGNIRGMFGGESFLDAEERANTIAMFIRHNTSGRGVARHGKWKLMANLSYQIDTKKWEVQTTELYDIDEDPREESPFTTTKHSRNIESDLVSVHDVLVKALKDHIHQDYEAPDGGSVDDTSGRVFNEANPILHTMPSPLYNISHQGLGIKKASGPHAKPNEDKRFLIDGHSQDRESVMAFNGWPANQPIWAPWLS